MKDKLIFTENELIGVAFALGVLGFILGAVWASIVF